MIKFLAVSVTAALLLIVFIIIAAANIKPAEPAAEPTAPAAQAVQTATAAPKEHMIRGIGVTAQGETDQVAGCETYAFAALMDYMKISFDAETFGYNYLVKSPISYDDDGNRYGPDMYTAFAGTLEEGYGIYAPAMKTSINNFLSASGQTVRAQDIYGKTLSQLCSEYVDRDIPVMIWANAYMQEPDEYVSWIVDKVDENARTKVGELFEWPCNEHCMLLIGYDAHNYYFSDSVAGKISRFDKNDSEQSYSTFGQQAIVVG